MTMGGNSTSARGSAIEGGQAARGYTTPRRRLPEGITPRASKVACAGGVFFGMRSGSAPEVAADAEPRGGTPGKLYPYPFGGDPGSVT